MARDFTSITDVIYRTASGINLPVADFTMMIWAYPDSEGEDGAGRFFAVDGTGGYSLFFFQSPATNRPVWALYFGGTERQTQGIDNDITLGAWAHWTTRYRASDDLQEILKNGAGLASQSLDPGATNITNPSIISSRISDFNIIHYLLSAVEWGSPVSLLLSYLISL